ncbi:MAG: hypothetical protein V2I33_23565 [Kangiellaceae bacterium]|nr:hypothetical protein [Kangiellaceae bacterium]
MNATIERLTHEKNSAATQTLDLSTQISKLELELQTARDDLKLAKQ